MRNDSQISTTIFFSNATVPTATNIYRYEIHIVRERGEIFFSKELRQTVHNKFMLKTQVILFSSVEVNYGSDAVPGNKHEMTRLETQGSDIFQQIKSHDGILFPDFISSLAL